MPVSMDYRLLTFLLTTGTSFSLFRWGGAQCFGRIGRLSDRWRWYIAYIMLFPDHLMLSVGSAGGFIQAGGYSM